MKKKILSFVQILILLIVINCIGANKLYDEDPQSAPFAAAHLDVSTSTFQLTGIEYAVVDPTLPTPVDDIPSQIYIPAINIFDAQQKLVYYKTGTTSAGYIYYVDSNVNYQILFTPFGPLCFTVSNYTYPKNIFEFSWMRRFGSVRMTEYAKESRIGDKIDSLYGKHNRICRKKPDTDILDHYVGIMNDGSTAGGDSNLQKAGVILNAFTSRYASVCYNKTIILIQAIQQFYPQLPPRNEYQARYQYTGISRVPPISTIKSEVDSYCQSPIPYEAFFNSECPWPLQPHVPCSSATYKSFVNNLTLEKFKNFSKFAKP